jgi:hypothetical protein
MLSTWAAAAQAPSVGGTIVGYGPGGGGSREVTGGRSTDVRLRTTEGGSECAASGRTLPRWLRRRPSAAIVATLLLVGFTLDRTDAGRRLRVPSFVALAGGRSHAEVLRSIGPTRRPVLREAAATLAVPYPPERLTLIGLKDQRVLEAWVSAPGKWRLLRSYPVFAASGLPGPKLRAGDLQVPEGSYAFNPNSSYHLSLRVDYPNADDRAAARAEGRTDLGGDIFIHGKAVSIGCLALGDAGIEELYVLVADIGLARTRLLLTPTLEPVASPASPAWLATRYERLAREIQAVRGGGRTSDLLIVLLEAPARRYAAAPGGAS